MPRLFHRPGCHALDDVFLQKHSDDYQRKDRSGRQRGKEIFVPAQHEAEDKGGDHAGQGDGQDDLHECAPDAKPVDQCCFFQFHGDALKLVAHDPDDNRQSICTGDILAVPSSLLGGLGVQAFKRDRV